ncbi:hypothetical protein E8E13_007011 [Curvularia kusanoi]|uniref:C2 NT-type domain-containing protein n=1 Tax=Curvularia kusanoi TaxID=90978 RepID=A0A9P4TJU6_CURKU|nr:hypothetical protein E8E13_007011 [Curvularia kusanoi]
MQAFVPKYRRPKFDLHLKIVDLNNVPLTSGKSFVKWHLPHSTAAEHRGKTDHCPIKEHKVSYNYDITLPVKLTVDKNGMLQENYIEFEVVQEYASSSRGERITLGNVKLNLAEYVEQSELAAESAEPGVVRRYLMQNSKINSTLKLGIYMQQTEGDKNFIAPALKTAQVFAGIAGIMAGEQAELEESGAAPSLTSKSRDASELQDMYRRTLAAYWSAQPGELKADECIEDIFAGGDGWGDRAKPYSPQRGNIRFAADTADGSASTSSDERHAKESRRMMRDSHDTLRPKSPYSGSPKQHVRGRGSLEQQAHHMKAEAERKRHRPHHEVDEQRKAKLGMKRMDEDADVLVLNEAPVQDELEPKQPEVLEPISVPDILASLEQDSAPATQEDVEKQLESLRPNRGNPDESQYVTTADFLKLVAALNRGFTHAQLSGYYSTAKSIKKGSINKVIRATVRATRRSQWLPITTNIENGLSAHEVLEGKTGKKQKPKKTRKAKAALIDKILRDVWRLELLEELEAPGEIELRLKEWELHLLQTGEPHAGTTGSESALSRIGRVRNAKVEIHWPSNLLRITADKTTAEYTADDVEATLSEAQGRTFDPQYWKELLDKEHVSKHSSLTSDLPIEYVSSITHTYIAKFDKDTIRIYGLKKDSIEEAERTLARFLPFKESAKRTIDTQRLDTTQHGTYLQPVYHDENSLDFIHRNVKLGRWVVPVSRVEGSATTTGPGMSEQLISQPDVGKSLHGVINRVASLLKPPVDPTSTGIETAPRQRQTGYWTVDPEYKMSADFGQSLFSLRLSDRNKVVDAIANPAVSPFRPGIPGLGNLLTSSSIEHLSRTETPALLYDFLPSPHQPHKGISIGPEFPRLYIQVRPGHDGGRPTVHKLSLGFHERIHDVLLPDRSVDIRFHRYGRLRFSIKSHHDANVEAWSEAVRQNIESGERLSAPSLTIGIPKWTIPGSSPDATGTVEVKYDFRGIQFRQSVSGRLLDMQISYSTLQSGKLGAQSNSLSAYPDKLKGADMESQIREFATKCMHMVDRISQAGAQIQPKNRKERRAAVQANVPCSASAENQDPGQKIITEADHDNSQSRGQTDSLESLETNADLVSRLDDVTPVENAEAALDEAYDEAEDNRRDAKSKLQQQEADALLEDLFGETAVDEKPIDDDQKKAGLSKVSEKS